MEKFSLDKVEKSTQEITKYIQESMKKMGCGTFEIEEYLRQAKKENIDGLITLSNEYIDMLNGMDPSQQECKVSYLW